MHQKCSNKTTEWGVFGASDRKQDAREAKPAEGRRNGNGSNPKVFSQELLSDKFCLWGIQEAKNSTNVCWQVSIFKKLLMLWSCVCWDNSIGLAFVLLKQPHAGHWAYDALASTPSSEHWYCRHMVAYLVCGVLASKHSHHWSYILILTTVFKKVKLARSWRDSSSWGPGIVSQHSCQLAHSQ